MNIIVPLDGSDKDERALQVAHAFGRVAGGDVRLVRLLAPTRQEPLALDIVGLTLTRSEMLTDAAKRLDEYTARLASLLPGNVTSEVDAIDGVDVVGELLRRAQLADLIVMATRAPGTMERAFFGSVADMMVRRAPCPVVLVPPGARYVSGQQIAIRRVIVPLDGSTGSETVVDPLFDLLPDARIESILMRVVDVRSIAGYVVPEPTLPVIAGDFRVRAPRIVHDPSAEARRYLSGVAMRQRQRGSIISTRVAESADPAEAIVAAIRTASADLIAMATHGAGGAERFFLGSIADAVVRKSDVPVLLVTPRSIGRENAGTASREGEQHR